MGRRDSQERFDPMAEVVPSPGDTALVIIDMQYAYAHPDHGLARRAKECGNFHIYRHLFERLEFLVPNIRRLQEACRREGIEVVFVKVQSYTQDGRDLSPSYKEKGMVYPPGSKEAEILEELKPVGDEIVLPKLSTSAFTASPIDQVLRYMGIGKLIVAGVNTNYCVETTIRDAFDRGYRVIMVEDACATVVEAQHKMAVEEIDDIFCKVKTTSEVLELIKEGVASTARSSPEPVPAS